MDGENVENDIKTIVWTENILFVFGAKAPFSKSGLVWMKPKSWDGHHWADNLWSVISFYDLLRIRLIVLKLTGR